mmetsp:Transcript_89536/g.204660  ORF Transcript_89536/g.204660 Transcript_89536/m.204660 type:complete len:343 (+) Transcript_89536:28-1056(+)
MLGWRAAAAPLTRAARPLALFDAARYSGRYSPIIKRTRVPFVDFETMAPKATDKPIVTTAFTKSKQQKLNTLLQDNPIVKFQGRVISELSCIRLSHGGRNIDGRVTTRHRMGGHKQRLRFIDFKRGRKDIYATVLRIEHAADRSSHIALIQYDDGVLSYILCPLTMRPGDRVIASENANVMPGNCLPLSKIPVGSIIHNIELRAGAGGQIQRAAGTYAAVVAKDDRYATIKLKSTELRKFPLENWATIGQLSNLERFLRIKGKAGVNRWLGWRPEVGGNAMNPNMHPHGGGSSHRGPRRNPVSRWGVHSKNYKTRAPGKPLGLILRRRLCGRLQRKFGILPP